MNKYLQIAKISWQNGLVYRLNFVMWRVRQVVQLLTVYFLWSVVSSGSDSIFSYQRSEILTYILFSSLIRSFVFSSRSIDAQGEIASGNLNNHLLKPFNYFAYWISRDFSDKALNIGFTVIELGVIFFLLKPPLALPSSLVTWLVFSLSLSLSTILYFAFSFIISMTTFWFYQHNGWAQRFLSFVLIESLAGGLFPLDILPSLLESIVSKLPTAYFIYFPLQIFLERLSPDQIMKGFGFTVFWIFALISLAYYLWRQGLKVYGAYGR